ncbi:uncharacterized protein LOC141595384 [Silene latifolia]|uniref:uncharacterized protein LOC141595384 n=1 Tax=Silene latifolia TaxID=37657 RepID=UPI003D78A61C
MSLHYCDKSRDAGIVEIVEDDVADEIRFGNNTLMDNFLGSKPKLPQVDDFVLKNWKNVTHPVVQYYKKGCFSFRFLSAEDMNEVLKGGPWTMGSSNLILKQWSPSFSQEMDSVSTVPAWVLFPDLDPFMWSENVLSKMASTIGKPLFADLPTTFKSKLLFARVLLEVNVAEELPKTVTVTSLYHGTTTQRIIYEWLPYYCHCCRKLVHTKEHCKFTKINKQLEEKRKASKVVQEYRPVQTAKSPPCSSEALDSECNGLGHNPPVTGGEQSTEQKEKSSECVELGSIPSSSEISSSPVVIEVGSGSHVLGPNCPDAVGREEGKNTGMDISQVDSYAVTTANTYSVLCSMRGNHWIDVEVATRRGSHARSMILSSWNIRGFNDPIKQHEVRGYLSRNKVEVFGLLETRVKEYNFAAISRTFSSYLVLNNYPYHYNGRIWVFLDTRRVTLISSYGHDQLVHLEVLHHISNNVIHVSFIYGSNDAGHRERLWNELTRLKAKVTNWILMGDWNIVRDMEERIGPNPPSVTEFPNTQVNVLASGISDHSPLLAWDTPVKGNAIYRLFSKLRNVKLKLINIHKCSFSWISEKVKVAYQQLQDCQLSLQTKPLDPSLLALEKNLLQTYLALKKAEKSSLLQRAKIQDIKYNDAPTSHYFARIAARKHQCIIGRIKDRNGVDKEGLSDVNQAFIDYYQWILGQQTPVDTTLMASLDGPKVPDSSWAELCREVEDKEIQTALFSIASNKSPGQDGFSAQFFKTSWNIVKHEFCDAVKGFFKTGKMSKQANTTLLTPIPKKPVVSTVLDYRPIACFTVFYKTVSKILCSRLKPILPVIVGQEQGALVAERSIFENIMLTQSLVKGYGQQGLSPRCLIKVDIRKAFDYLQWDFIGKMLQYFKFPEKFQRWIMESITSTWFSLKINGDHIGFFKGASGLRQGDPLSPFLFVMSMEILSRILRGIHQQYQVSYHPKCGKLGLNHLIFADDLMLFVRGDTPSVQAITSSLDSFALLSGLHANPEKTNIYMAGIRDNIKQEILTVTAYTEGFFPFIYLGVPLNAGKLNKTMFADLIAKVQKVLNHWRFLWDSEESHRKLIMKSWDSCCAPYKEGGFNIKAILAWNKCIICKWIWGIIQHSDSIWTNWNFAYNIKSGDFWTLRKKNTHSESWRSILLVRDELLTMVGNGTNAESLLSGYVKKGCIQLSLLYD